VGEKLELPDNLVYKKISVLMIVVSFDFIGFQPNFLDKFVSLSSLVLKNFTLNSMKSILELPHLRYLCLDDCCINDTEDLTILENCTSLQELQLLCNTYPKGVIKLPPNLRKLTCFGIGKLKSVDGSNCTQLDYVRIWISRGSNFWFILPLIPCLRTLDMMNGCILDAVNLSESLESLRKFILDSHTLKINYEWFRGNEIRKNKLYLHFEHYPKLEKLCITIDDDFKEKLKCTFPCGNGNFYVKLTWPNFWRPKKTYEITLDPKKLTNESIKCC